MTRRTLWFAAAAALILAAPFSRAADVTLTWQNNDATAPQVRVYEHNLNHEWVLIQTVIAPAGSTVPNTVTLQNVTPGIHTYRVTAFDSIRGESDFSNEASTLAIISAPSNLTAVIVVSVTVAAPAAPPPAAASAPVRAP